MIGDPRALAAAAAVYDLEQPRYSGAPVFPVHHPGFVYSLYRRHAPAAEARTGASGIAIMAEHSGTHIDALCHQAENLLLHGGVVADDTVQRPDGFTTLGVESIAPIVARGVLLDVATAAGLDHLPAGQLVGAGELEAAARAEIMPGDVVLVRTGTGALWSDPDAYVAGAGMSAEASRWVAERRPLAVGSDNLAWDLPGHVDSEVGSLPGHTILLVPSGIFIVENLFLEALARDGHSEFLFVCLPLKMKGATGSPVRPIAVCDAG